MSNYKENVHIFPVVLTDYIVEQYEKDTRNISLSPGNTLIIDSTKNVEYLIIDQIELQDGTFLLRLTNNKNADKIISDENISDEKIEKLVDSLSGNDLVVNNDQNAIEQVTDESIEDFFTPNDDIYNYVSNVPRFMLANFKDFIRKQVEYYFHEMTNSYAYRTAYRQATTKDPVNDQEVNDQTVNDEEYTDDCSCEECESELKCPQCDSDISDKKKTTKKPVKEMPKAKIYKDKMKDKMKVSVKCKKK